jgi:hypothetical protein
LKPDNASEIDDFSDLYQILSITGDRFILVKNYMRVENSFLYGYLNGETCKLRKINNFWDFEQKNNVETYTQEEIMEKIKKETRISNLNELYTEGDGNYQSIYKFSALTINPYKLSISERVKKMKSLLMKTGKFKKIGDADLFLYDLKRKTVTVMEDEKRYILNYVSLLDGSYLFFDIKRDRLIIDNDENIIQKMTLEFIKKEEH